MAKALQGFGPWLKALPLRSLCRRTLLSQASRPTISRHRALSSGQVLLDTQNNHNPDATRTVSLDGPTPVPSELTAEEAASIEQTINELDFEQLYENTNPPAPTAWISSFPGAHRVGMMELHPTVFGQDIRRIDLLHRTVVWQRSLWRTGNAKVKGRAEVRGGGKKPHPQKGTGQARASSIRAPNWRGGGVVHGPVPRDWSLKLPRKVRVKALMTAISTRYQQGDLDIVDDVYMPTRKTKVLHALVVGGALGLCAMAIGFCEGTNAARLAERSNCVWRRLGLHQFRVGCS
eukprot:TRINITY_DN7202_c0_g1_i2.p1 TRINITY_DN7202_c0_g1~~TRINITY_DN7202_c0_g1_i2.p1  ORF type:complete len:290 (+),score=5.83 TRINITY_DN7202_c0_g1_i2:3-872(+)